MAVGVFTAEVVILAVSRLWLIYFYRPSQAQAWNVPFLHTGAGLAGFLLHTFVLSVPLLGTLFVAWRPRRREAANTDAIDEKSGTETRGASWVG